MEILMPQMGVSVDAGTIIEWSVSVGDKVEADQPVCEVTTDKVDTEILAPADGEIVDILVQAGEEVEVGRPVARMAAVDEDPATVAADSNRPGEDPGTPVETESAIPAADGSSQAESTTSPGAQAAIPTEGPRHQSSEHLAGAIIDPAAAADVSFSRTGGRPLASPLARRIAGDKGVDLAGVRGTGRHGRIRKEDVLEAARSGQIASPAVGAVASAPAGPAPVLGIPRGYEQIPHRIVPTSHLRRAISEHMIRSRQTAAHMTTEVEVDMHHLSQVRAAINAAQAAQGARRISFLSFISRAAIATLSEFPELNATFQHEQSIQWQQVNLGVAVDAPGGLIVPVIHGADRMTVETIADSVAEIADRARSRKLTPDDLAGGTFTISNPGSVGAVSAPAIINQPQVAILGTPAIVKRPWVVTSEDGEDAIMVRPILKLALTFDHRAIDGADATRYAVAVKDRLESWNAEAYR